jgi:hypothetical protein
MNEPSAEYLNPEGFREFVSGLEAFVTKLRNSKDMSYTGLMKAAGWNADDIRGAMIAGVDLSGSDMQLFSNANADLRGARFKNLDDLPRDCWLEKAEFEALLARHQTELSSRPGYSINRRGLVLGEKNVIVCDENTLTTFDQDGRQMDSRQFGQGKIILASQPPVRSPRFGDTRSLLLILDNGRIEWVDYHIDQNGPLRLISEKSIQESGRSETGFSSGADGLNEAALIPNEPGLIASGDDFDLLLLSADYSLHHLRYSDGKQIESKILDQTVYGICATVKRGAYLAVGAEIHYYNLDSLEPELWHSPPAEIKEPASKITFWRNRAIIQYQLGSLEMIDVQNPRDSSIISLINNVASDPQCRPLILNDEVFWLWMHSERRIVLESLDRRVVATSTLPFVNQARLHVRAHSSGGYIEITDKAGTFVRLDAELNFICGAVFSTAMTEIAEGYSFEGKLLNLYGEQLKAVAAPDRQVDRKLGSEAG